MKPSLRWTCLVLLCVSACAAEPERKWAAGEQEEREALGIPDNAQRVLFFGQNAHMDLNWEYTTQEYYDGWVEEIFERAINANAADPDYRYAIAEMEFLRMYWNDHPERQATLRALFESGHFKAVGGGVSSPDVLLPFTENLLHDYREGAHWLSSVGLHRTQSAWLPDDFGLGPTTPDLLAAAGYDAVAFWRVDGNPDSPNLNASVRDFASPAFAANSNAALLGSMQGSADFLWRGPGGGTVFAHWLVHSYMFGEYIDYFRIVARGRGEHAGSRTRDPEVINDNIQAYVDLVGPYSPTDYMFVPVGGDFVYPKDLLAQYARDWNERRFAETGVWVVAASFDDFKSLAMKHPELLPVRELDMTPYWMGFYASHPEIKRGARGLGADLTVLEKLATLNQLEDNGAYPEEEISNAWWTAAASDHHDWVTGTSVPHVIAEDQIPRLNDANALTQLLLNSQMVALADHVAEQVGDVVLFNADGVARDGVISVPATLPEGTLSASFHVGDDVFLAQPDLTGTHVFVDARDVPSVGWVSGKLVASDGVAPELGPTVECLDASDVVGDCQTAVTVRVTTPTITARLNRARGGVLTSLVVDGVETLDGDTGDFVVYDDGGGQYMFGHENACTFAPWHSAGDVATDVDFSIGESGPIFESLVFRFNANGVGYQRVWTFYKASSVVDMNVSVAAIPGTSVMARFSLAASASKARMAVPAGAIDRSVGGRFAPTFVPFERWFDYSDASSGAGVTIIAPANPAMTFSGDGTLDLVLQRQNATSCQGHSDGNADSITGVTIRLVPHAHALTDHQRYAFAADVWTPMRGVRSMRAAVAPGQRGSLLSLLSDGAHLLSAHADGGQSVIVRVQRDAADTQNVMLRAPRHMITRVERINATEDALAVPDAPLTPNASQVTLPLAGTITTWRVSLTRLSSIPEN